MRTEVTAAYDAVVADPGRTVSARAARDRLAANAHRPPLPNRCIRVKELGAPLGRGRAVPLEQGSGGV